jgi:hypothetical protein
MTACRRSSRNKYLTPAILPKWRRPKATRLFWDVSPDMSRQLDRWSAEVPAYHKRLRYAQSDCQLRSPVGPPRAEVDDSRF